MTPDDIRFFKENPEAYYEACRQHPIIFTSYVFGVVPSRLHYEMQNLLTLSSDALIMVPRNHGKCLSLDTPIPTPTGWATMADLTAGDQVFDELGVPCNVTEVHPVLLGNDCYRVTFSDGTSVVCDAEHLWVTKTRYPWQKVNKWTTEEIRRTLRHGKRGDLNHATVVNEALQTPQSLVAVEPYALGYWLGDGSSRAPQLTIGGKDYADAAQVLRESGARLGDPRPDRDNFTVHLACGSGYGPVKTSLRSYDLLQNKHIPRVYLRASISQRMALLQGLMDTDGSVDDRGTCEFTTVNRRLGDGVLELVRSLGFKSRIIEGDATLDGRVVSRKYRIMFTAYRDNPVFRLPRKVARLRPPPDKHPRSRTRMITKVEPVQSVPVRCISVDSPSHLFLCGEGMVPTHNTVQVTVGRVAWEIGKNPDIRVQIVQNTKPDAMKTVGAIKEVIESPEYQNVFPNIEKTDIWGKEQIKVKRNRKGRDATVTANSITGRAGQRSDLLIADDVEDLENSIRQPGLREQVKQAWAETWIPTLEPDARVWRQCTPWSPDGINMLWKDQAEKEGMIDMLFRPCNGVDASPWPERWTPELLRSRRSAMGSRAYARAYELVPISSEDLMFDPNDLLAASVRSWKREDLMRPVRWAFMDLAYSEVEQGLKGGSDDPDYSVLFVCDITMDGHVFPVRLLRGRYRWPEFKTRIRNECERLEVKQGFVESNGPQKGYRQDIADMLGKIGIPVEHDNRGVDRVSRAAVVQPVVEHHKFHLPVNSDGMVQEEFLPMFEELGGFPLAAHDDCADCAIDACRKAMQQQYADTAKGPSRWTAAEIEKRNDSWIKSQNGDDEWDEDEYRGDFESRIEILGMMGEWQ